HQHRHDGAYGRGREGAPHAPRNAGQGAVAYGEDCAHHEVPASTEVPDARLSPLQAVRPPARVSPEVRDVPALLSRTGAQGRGAGHREGELVRPCEAIRSPTC